MKLLRNILLLSFVLSIGNLLIAQPDYNDDSIVQSNTSNLNPASLNLVKSISKNSSKKEIAEDYYLLALELIKLKDFKKAEKYLKKAINVASNDINNLRIGDYYRELAKIQEILKKSKDASKNFENAFKYSNETEQRQINHNDASRVQYQSDPMVELEYLNQNAIILSNSSNVDERVQNYNKIADVNVTMNQTDEALEYYNKALVEVDDNSNESLEIQSDIANLLAETDQYDEAIDMQKKVVAQSQEFSNVETQVQQMRQLSDIYFASNSSMEGLNTLLDAYTLAIEKGNLNEARESLIELVEFYEENKNDQEILLLYGDFINNLEALIAKDNSLIDIKLFELTEEKIDELEEEKVLKDEMIDRKNNYNYILALLALLLLILMIISIRSSFSIRKRNKQIALQSLRREMNPHFIFNSLNSVNQFIANNNELAANKYLTSYSNLMRRMMENSNKDYVSLNVEIDLLTKYLELERLRFADKFEYKIDIDSELDIESQNVPNMLIQPNLENAIWHGLRYKESMGFLSVRFIKKGNKTAVEIEDNGIGLTKSKDLKTDNQKLHKSRGLKNVEERIRLLNEINKKNINFEIIEKTGDESGVIVKIEW